jgi:Zn-dependent peptidase ImmA (M78 family)/transcriptional regulator with XRE-family HTH domain
LAPRQYIVGGWNVHAPRATVDPNDLPWWEDEAVRTLAHVTPQVLRWARESIGYEVDEAARRIGVTPEKLEGAEAGDLMLTLRQAEKAADVYNRPLAALFLPEPPREEPQEAQFRRLPGAPAPPWPPEMQTLARRVEARQEAAVELYEALEEEPPWPSAVTELTVEGEALPGIARQVLGVGFDEQTSWRDYNGYTPLREWTDAVESLGVLVLQDGSMPVEMMRGFAATHPLVPVIVVNTKDDARARAFTIIHELGHLYLDALGEAVGSQTEQWCDSFAGEVLMPRGWIENILSGIHGRSRLETIDQLALRFGVTPYAAAVRVAKEELWPKQVTNQVIDAIHKREPRERGNGGDYYLTQIGRLSPTYARLVFNALDGQALTYPAASSLLGGVKVNNFGKLREKLDKRAARA